MCAHTVCAPSGPCQLNSTCNAADGTCIPQHVAAGKPCLSGRGACTAAHTCDLCAGVVCTPKGPCESNSTCNPADGMCVPEFVAPGQPCLDARGTCNANHTCDACGTSCGPHGSCNSEAGMCVCAPGWGGMACSQELPQGEQGKTRGMHSTATAVLVLAIAGSRTLLIAWCHCCCHLQTCARTGRAASRAHAIPAQAPASATAGGVAMRATRSKVRRRPRRTLC